MCLKIFFLKTSQIFCKVFMFLFNFFINCKITLLDKRKKETFFLKFIYKYKI